MKGPSAVIAGLLLGAALAPGAAWAGPLVAPQPSSRYAGSFIAPAAGEYAGSALAPAQPPLATTSSLFAPARPPVKRTAYEVVAPPAAIAPPVVVTPPAAPAQPAPAVVAPPMEVPGPTVATGPAAVAAYFAGGRFAITAEPTLWYSPGKRAASQLIVPNAAGVGQAVSTLRDEDLNYRNVPGARVSAAFQVYESNAFVSDGAVLVGEAEARFLLFGERSSDGLVEGIRGAAIVEDGLATGRLTIRDRNQMWGGEANYWWCVCCDPVGTCYSVDVMGGFRYLSLNESIDLERTTSFAPALAAFPAFAGLAGSRIVERDSLLASNHFYGGQAGVRGHFYFNPVTVTGYAQLALGVTSSTLKVGGESTLTNAAGQQATTQGGVLTRPETVGQYERTRFTYVPEMGLSLSTPLSDCLTISGGFSALHFGQLVRPAGQVRPDGSSPLLGLPARPGTTTAAVGLNDSGQWILGFHVGAELRF